jgi:hypothetical protein
MACHWVLRLAAMAIKMTSAPTTMPPEVSPTTIHIQFCNAHLLSFDTNR